MSSDTIANFRVTVPLTIEFNASFEGVQVVGASMDGGPVPINLLDQDKPPVVQTEFQEPDTKVWPDGLEDLSLVSANEELQCPDSSEMQYYIVYEDPQILYIPEFVSAAEIAHLLDATKDSFSSAWVYRDGVSSTDDNYRKSENAWPARDEVVQCIEQRAVRFQPDHPNLLLEEISVQRYHENGFFSYHHDNFASPPNRMNRLSTFNVFLQGDCTGGGTHFPWIPRPEHPNWCQYIDCESTEAGTIFKPVAGAAVFWVNTREDGTGFVETLHAGMPVNSGTKVGMNIWSWENKTEQALPEEDVLLTQ